jgi:hypothetical protein
MGLFCGYSYSNRLAQVSHAIAMALILALALLSAGPVSGQVNVTTYHNDNARTGQNLNETILTPANVRPGTFGRLFTQLVDGKVYAQPLYLSNVEIPEVGKRNVVFVATQHDSVYAFDADSNTGPSGGLLWHVSFIDPDNGITSVPAEPNVPGVGWGDIRCCCPDITPEIGITATPVIDPVKGILYVISKAKEIRDTERHYVQRLHALDVRTGGELMQQVIADTIWVSGNSYIYDDFGPTVIGSPRADDSVNGVIHFNALTHHLRSGLALANGVIYAAWASHCDHRPYHGWIMSFDASTLELLSWFNTTPGSPESTSGSWGGGIWMGGDAPAIDNDGNLYCSTGNGGTGQDTNVDYGEAVLRLSTSDELSLTDLFIPFNQMTLDSRDDDLASGGVMLVPDQQTEPPHLLITAGKEGKVYLIDRDRMGGYRQGMGCDQSMPPVTCDAVVQVLPSRTIAGGGLQGTPAFYQNLIYFGGAGDFLKTFALTNGRLSTTAMSQSSTRFGNKGATVSVSANGNRNGIVWANRVDGESFLRLYAYDALNLGTELYSSGEGEILGATKFSLPTIANGKVYVGIGRSSLEDFGGLVVFGLLSRE